MTTKIILTIIMVLFAIPTYAVDMCASDNAIVVVLDPNIYYTSATYDKPTSTWRAVFSYGTITGVSACLNYNNTQSADANNGTVFGGEQSGFRCWCKMTHPAVSQWVFNYDYGTGIGISGCAEGCTERCKSFVAGGSSSDITNHKKLFKTIAN